MPKEYSLLLDAPIPIDRCPKCQHSPFQPFLRGTVQNNWRKLLRKPYCCLICSVCKGIVGYEKPYEYNHKRRKLTKLQLENATKYLQDLELRTAVLVWADGNLYELAEHLQFDDDEYDCNHQKRSS